MFQLCLQGMRCACRFVLFYSRDVVLKISCLVPCAIVHVRSIPCIVVSEKSNLGYKTVYARIRSSEYRPPYNHKEVPPRPEQAVYGLTHLIRPDTVFEPDET